MKRVIRKKQGILCNRCRPFPLEIFSLVQRVTPLQSCNQTTTKKRKKKHEIGKMEQTYWAIMRIFILVNCMFNEYGQKMTNKSVTRLYSGSPLTSFKCGDADSTISKMIASLH